MNQRLIAILELSVIIVFIVLRARSEAFRAMFDNKQELQAIMGYVLFLIVVDALRRFFTFVYRQKNQFVQVNSYNFHYGINNIARLLVGIGTVVALFGFFGVDIRTLLTSASIVAAAIAIITKEYVNDYLIGLYFSFSKNIEIQDYIKVGEQKGRIVEIQMLKMKLLNDDDDLVILPNRKIYDNEIINYTKRDLRSLSVDFEIDLKSVQSIELFEKELIDSLSDFHEYLEMNSFNLKIVEMKKDFMELKFHYGLKDFDRDVQRNIRRKTVRQVFNHITERRSSMENAALDADAGLSKL